MDNPSPVNRATEMLRAMYHIDRLSLCVEQSPGPDDSWVRAKCPWAPEYTSEWIHGDVIAAVRDVVEHTGHTWTECDDNILLDSGKATVCASAEIDL